MKAVLLAGAISLLVSLLGTPLYIKFLVRRGYGQFIRDDGPTSHHTKRGTPTMGGALIIAASLLAYGGAHLFRAGLSHKLKMVGQRGLTEVLQGADILLGLSAGGVVKPAMVALIVDSRCCEPIGSHARSTSVAMPVRRGLARGSRQGSAALSLTRSPRTPGRAASAATTAARGSRRRRRGQRR